MMGPRLKVVQQMKEKGEYNLLIVGLSSAVYYDEEVPCMLLYNIEAVAKK